MLAVEEYEELQVNLELEKDLRKKAESFAQEVSVLQKPGILQNAYGQSGVLQKPGVLQNAYGQAESSSQIRRW